MIRKRGIRQLEGCAVGHGQLPIELIRKRGRRHSGKVGIDKEKGLKARGEGSSYITKLYYTI